MIHLTGRITKEPNSFINQHILEPHFAFELEHLTNHYIEIELVMNREYERLGLINHEERLALDEALKKVDISVIQADPSQNMSDMSFAIEKFVESQLDSCVPVRWHSDRSRNDVQSCAQAMFLKEQVVELEQKVEDLIGILINRSQESTKLPLPGKTHYQPAQVITPAFYFLSIVEELTHIRKVLLNVFDYIDQCPLGSGAMAGLEYAWDRQRMAEELGFRKPKDTALASIASKQGILEVAAAQGNLGVLISRLATDLMDWLIDGYIDLPDELSGISSAMPQKKNYPIMERIRGQNAHMITFYTGIALSQKNTPFTNLVETAKEGGKYVGELFHTSKVNLSLMRIVLENLSFIEEKMLDDCSKGFFGGFAFANHLTREYDVPNRKAQSIVGEIIRTAIEKGVSPSGVENVLVQEVCHKHGYSIRMDQESILALFSIPHNVNKQTSGSTNPASVEALLHEYLAVNHEIGQRWEKRNHLAKS
ncbi:lyase family protein [Rossellomorea marisflavi]|uniref:lyase family protein n=1 Tax=Rossellomorea marisflavi TaxID=189381 RepID=UPI00296EC404|nr:lyase family protein [Rossellomorea marisflavi]MDW4525512.1 lyase family protein [Rossellomorea marisflavi]